MKPAMLDWILLPYLVCLALAPAAIQLGLAPQAGALLLSLFPFGPLATALVLIVLRTMIPALRFDFGLSGGRWGAIIALLVIAGHAAFGIGFATQALSIGWPSADVISGRWMMMLPSLLVCAMLIYVLICLFSGKPLGPRRTPIQKERFDKCK
jgi:hypothetical protein